MKVNMSLSSQTLPRQLSGELQPGWKDCREGALQV